MTIPGWLADLVSPLDSTMGMELLEVSAERAVARYPVAGNTQPAGLWHGGASGVVAETLASLAALAEVGPGGSVAGIELNASHLRPARTGMVTGTAKAVRIGGRLATYRVDLVDETGAQICAARVTVALTRS